MELLNSLTVLAGMDQLGLVAIAAAICVCLGTFSSIGEGMIACHAIDAMARNPEKSSELKSTMILAIALDESTAIYALVVAILILFVLGGKISA